MEMAHDFVLDLLFALEPRVKPMFGVHSIYIGEKIYLATRHREKNAMDNGVWIGLDFEHHDWLKNEFPSIRHLQGIPLKKWLIVPEEAEDFEEVVTAICQLILEGEQRLGTVPKPKKKKTKK